MLTFKKIYNLFKTISENHKMINGFGIGDIYEQNIKNDENYPLLFLEIPSQLSNSGAPNFINTWSIGFKIVDKFESTTDDSLNFESRSNAISKCEQIGQSIINKLNELKGVNVSLMTNYDAATVFESTNPIEAGMFYNIALYSPRSITHCFDLFDNVDISTILKEC